MSKFIRRLPPKARRLFVYMKDAEIDPLNGKGAEDGGPGSGNWGHKGRPGHVGGSGKGGGKQYRGGRSDIAYVSSRRDWLNGLTGEKQHEAQNWKKRMESHYAQMSETAGKSVEQNIMEEPIRNKFGGSGNEIRSHLLGYMAEARGWDKHAAKLADENWDDNDRKLAGALAVKYGISNLSKPGVLIPDDSSMTDKWDEEDLRTWYDLKSKAMGGPTSGKEAPDELQYEAGTKERPAPRINVEWIRGHESDYAYGASSDLSRASGIRVDPDKLKNVDLVEQAETKAFERIMTTQPYYNAALTSYLETKWQCSGGFNIPQEILASRLTEEELARYNQLMRTTMLYGMQETPAGVLSYKNPEERVPGLALLNKALGGVDMTAQAQEAAKKIEEEKAEERRKAEEERKRIEAEQQRMREERARAEAEREAKRKEDLKNGTCDAIRDCEANSVARVEPKRFTAGYIPLGNMIIEKVGGGDRTQGSCQSLALAYAANKLGFDITDFRGGTSQAIFCRGALLADIAEAPGVNGSVIRQNNNIDAMKTLLAKMEPDKEYIIGGGHHAAIVRIVPGGSGYEYLELQTPNDNGWKRFGSGRELEKTLRERFGCHRSNTTHGFKFDRTHVLVEIKAMKDCKVFENMLPYINTKAEDQKKGAGGYAK